ncbi:MAG: stage IV sporulation protein A, partial [Clostridiales bacterium]|nr:stage IV sporulation protein A [Clostridiales bacterium]
MEKFDVLQDIAERTGGDIYLGVVGPVRTGKSTFIKRFMEILVLPGILDYYERERAHDELPQSGAGRTVMTTEPKFVPSEAVEIPIQPGIAAHVRLVDCVGYSVSGALGFVEADGPRMVSTPWFDDPIPFEEAAEIGTKKVITDHSTIGLIVISDGSITEIPRENYLLAEQRVVEEMKELGKPFIIILNCLDPLAPAAAELAGELSARYNVSVLPMNVATMSYESIQEILMEALYEFPVTEIKVSLPAWVEELEREHWLRRRLESEVRAGVQEVKRVRDISVLVEKLNLPDLVSEVQLKEMVLGSGEASLVIVEAEGLFYRILAEYAGMEIEGEQTIMRLVKEYSHAHSQWSKMASAMEEVEKNGYGVVSPRIDEMFLEEPELIKQGGRFGVKLRASAPSYH